MPLRPGRFICLLGLLALTELAGSACHSKPKNEALPPLASASKSEPLARQLCEALHALPAERRAKCCSDKLDAPLLDECVRTLARSVAKRAVELDPNRIGACAAEMQRSLSGCDWVTPSHPLAPAACQNAIRGQLRAGASCESSLECAGNLHCEGSTPTQAGRCAAPAPIGAACGSQVDTLASFTLARDLERSHPSCTSFCSLTRRKCEPTPLEGAPCVASVNCGPGQSCLLGACSRARGALNSPCSGPSCEQGLRCLEGRCRPFSRAGERCATDFDCEVGGCIPDGSGVSVCGAKCTLSMAASKGETARAMRLPLRPRE